STTYVPGFRAAKLNCPAAPVVVDPEICPVSALRNRTAVLGIGWLDAVRATPEMLPGGWPARAGAANTGTLGAMSATMSEDKISRRNIFDIENLTATITRLLRAVNNFTQCDANDTF